MASVNKVILLGNLGRDPEVRYSADGAAICNISVATTSSWKDKNSGERRDETEWHRVVFYGRLAEIVGEHMKKGRSIYLEGRLKTRKWTDKENIERYTTEVVADQMQMLGGKDRQDDDTQQGGAPAGDVSEPAPKAGAGKGKGKGRAQGAAPAAQPVLADLNDDIPF